MSKSAAQLFAEQHAASARRCADANPDHKAMQKIAAQAEQEARKTK